MLFYFHPGDLDASVLPALIVYFALAVFLFVILPVLFVYYRIKKSKDGKQNTSERKEDISSAPRD